jgi:co-chaperonin GroES (HSP10)
MEYKIENLSAKGHHVLVVRDEIKTERNGLPLTDWELQNKPNTGKVISVGKLVDDNSIKKNDIAVFPQKSGFEIEFSNGTVTVLRDEHIISTICD